MTTVLEVYEADNTTLVDTIDAGQWASVGTSVAMALGGGGRLALPRIIAGGVANPGLALLTRGRIVRAVVNGVDSGQFVWEQPEDVLVSPQEEAGEVSEVKGREPAAVLLDKARWFPDRGLGVLPFTPDRGLDVRADRLRDDDPAGPQGAWPFGTPQVPEWDTANWYGRAAGYVDTAGPGGTGPHVVADRDSRVAGAPGGRVYYRQRDTIAAAHDAVLVQAFFDDQGVLFVNGYPTLRAEGVYKGQCVQAIIPLSAGDCLVAGWFDNLNELRCGVAFAIWSIVDGLATTCLMRSDGSKMRVLGYPTKPPGFTPTEVIRLGWDEAQDRGMLTNVTCNFLSAVDTAGAAMTEVTDITVRAPHESLLTTVRMLTETYLDVSAAPDSLELRAWNRGTQGVDRTATVSFAKGTCASIRRGYDFAEHATVALVTVEGEAPFEVLHPDSAAPPDGYGRIETSLDFGQCSIATARVWARKYLDVLSTARRSIELTLTPGVGAVPHVDFGIADWITLGDETVAWTWGVTPGTFGLDPMQSVGEPVRVAAIGLEVDSASIERWTVELEQPKVLLEERLGNIMRRQTGPGRTILPVASEPQNASNGAGSETTETWSAAALGTVVLTKNGTPITGASLAASGGVTLTNAARKCATGDRVSFTVGGVDGFPAGWPVPAPGCWIQHMTVVQGTGTTVTIAYTTGVQ